MKPMHDERLLSGLYLPNSLMYFILHITTSLYNNIKRDLLLTSHREQ